MQIIHKNKNERSTSRETDSINIIYAEKIGRHLEGKHVGEFRSRSVGI